MKALFAILMVLIVTSAASFPLTSVFGQFSTTGPVIPTTPAAPTPVPATTFQSTDDDSFRVQVPQGWMIHDLDNTGSALLQEATQGYGILAQLCPQEEHQEAALPSVGGGSTTTSSNSCQGAQEVVYIIRYPDLETRIQAANTVTTNNIMTTDNVLSYHLQKLQEVGYRDIQTVNSTATTVNITNPQTNETIATVPAKFVEMTYSTNSAPNETRTGYLISTATNATPPNVGTTKGYSVFYEGSSTLLPPAVGQIFDSFELIAVPEAAPTPATPTPTPPAQLPTNDGVLILGSSQVSTDFGSTYIVGEVRNNLSDVVNYVQIVGRFYDSGGLLIDTDFTYTELDDLRPGEKSPFKLIITDESVASRIDNYTLSVNWQPVYANADAVAAATVLTIQEGEQRIGEFGWYEVVGEVVNGGTDSTKYVKVVATFYDEAGQVINTDYTYTDPSDLAAGQSAPFELSVSDEDISEDIESVKLSAQSQDYFAVDPELTESTPTTPTLSPPEQQEEQQQQPSPSPQSEQPVL